MQARPPIYIVSTTAQETETLQTVLHFIGETYETVEGDDLKNKVNALNPLCIILGTQENL